MSSPFAPTPSLAPVRAAWLGAAVVSLPTLVGPAVAHADDGVTAGAAIGAGGQGSAGYGALELRLDAAWRGVRVGLGGRLVMLGGELRTQEWSRPADAVALVRQLEAQAGPVAIAAGGLAPATLGHVAEGYRAALDDRARTGVRVALATRGLGDADTATSGADVDATLELDDVLDPALAGGALGWRVVPAWGVAVAAAVDPATDRVAFEASGARRWERSRDTRVELGAGLVGERWRSAGQAGATRAAIGAGAVAFASAALDRGGARWTLAADVRAGTGTNGAAFGPLYRVERSAGADGATPLDDVRAGLGAGASASVISDALWLSAGGRWRPGLGALGTLGAAAPMGQRWQAAAWLAASARATAGAAELRAAWTPRLSTSLQLARMYTDLSPVDAMARMGLSPAWSATVWFGASTR